MKDFLVNLGLVLLVVKFGNCIKIDTQLQILKNDCYERLAIGQRLKPKDVYKTSSSVTTVKECQLECTKEQKLCKSFSFGIGVKGNTTCELNHDEIKETADLKPIGTRPETDFDLYIKKHDCTVVLDPAVAAAPQKPQNGPQQSHDNAHQPSTHSNYNNKPPQNSDYGSQNNHHHNRPINNFVTNDDGPHHVQTLVSISTGPQRPVLHPIHEILIAANPYDYSPVHGHHQGASGSYRPIGHNDLASRPDPDRYDSRPEPSRPSYDHRPMPDRYGSIIPRPEDYDFRPRPEDRPQDGYYYPRPISGGYDNRPRPFNDRPDPIDRPRPDRPYNHFNDYHDRPMSTRPDLGYGPIDRPKPSGYDYGDRPRPDYIDRPGYNDRPKPGHGYIDGPGQIQSGFVDRPRPGNDYKPGPGYIDGPGLSQGGYSDRLKPGNDYNDRPKPGHGYIDGPGQIQSGFVDRPRPGNDYKPGPGYIDGPGLSQGGYSDRLKPGNDYNDRPKPGHGYIDGPGPIQGGYGDRPKPGNDYSDRPKPGHGYIDGPGPIQGGFVDRPRPGNDYNNRPKPGHGYIDGPGPSQGGYDDRPKPGNGPKPGHGYIDGPGSSDAYNNRPKPGYHYDRPENGNNYLVDRYDREPGKPVISTKPSKGNHSNSIITQSVGPHGEEITSIITELESACFRRVLAGKRVGRGLVERALFCERIEDCQAECAEEKRFACEGFNYRLDPSGRGKGECELLDVPLTHLDIGRDLYADPDYDYYERDRNAAATNCMVDRPGPGYDSYFDRPGGDRYGGGNRFGGNRRPRPDFDKPPLPGGEYGGGGNGNRRGDYDVYHHSSSHHSTFHGGQAHYYDSYGTSQPRPIPPPPPYDYKVYEPYLPPPNHFNYGTKYDQDDKNDDKYWGKYGGSYGTGGYRNNYDWGLMDKYGPPEVKPSYLPPVSEPAASYLPPYGGGGSGGSYLPPVQDGYGPSQNALLPAEPRQPPPSYDFLRDECSLRTATGFKLSRGIVKKFFAVPNIYECEVLCFKESEFPCASYAYRYTVGAPTENCYLSNRNYKELDFYTDLQQDRDFDIYTMNNPSRCEAPVVQSKDNSECFWRVRSAQRLDQKVVRDSLLSNSIVDCQLACLKSARFTCRAYSFRYGSPIIGGIIDNCQLTDWPYQELDPGIHFVPEPGFEVYERGSYGHGCEPDHFGIRGKPWKSPGNRIDQLCYVGYGSPARLLPQATKKSLRVLTELDCKSECSKYREGTLFQCMSFSYSNNIKDGPNCFLSDILQRDLLPIVDYIPDRESWLFAWDNYNPECIAIASDTGSRHNHIGTDYGIRDRHDHYQSHALDTWRVYSVSGWPCRRGTLCRQNLEAGFWFCELAGGDSNSWDYCCRPDHQCGYSEGFPYQWCHVGPGRTQWRKCSDRYYPYVHNLVDRVDPPVHAWSTANHLQIPPGPPHRPGARPDRPPARPSPPLPAPSLDRYEMQFDDQFLDPPRPGGFGQGRHWPVSYLHKEMPPNNSDSEPRTMEGASPKFAAIQNLIDIIKSNDLKNVQYQISNQSNKEDDILFVKIPLPTNFTSEYSLTKEGRASNAERLLSDGPIDVFNAEGKANDTNNQIKRSQKSLPPQGIGPVYRRSYITRANVTRSDRF